MPNDKAMGEQDVAWIKEGHLQSKRVEQHFLRGLFIWFLCDDLNNARSNVEPSIVIRPDRSQWLDLRELCNIFHHFIQGIVTIAKVIEIITNPSAHVSEKMTNCYLLGNLFIAQFEVFNIFANRCVEINFSLLSQLHKQRACKRFADGSDLKKSIRC